MILEAMQHGGTFISNDQFTVQYVGDPVIQADYTIALGGMPKDTILNPTQRGYIGQVTSDFLEAYSSSEVYSLEIISQSFDQSQKRNLRRLQDGLVFVEASIFGVGVGNEAEEDFYASLDETFQSNSDQLLKHMSQQQYRPGRINSGSEDFGQVFASLISATAERYTAPSTEPQTTNSTASGSKKKVGFTETAQTTTWSLVLLFSTTFLAYNIMKDFFCEKRKVSPIMKDAIRDHENSKIGEFEEPSETSIGSKDSKQTGMTGFFRKVSIVKDKNNDSTSKSTARTNSSANDQNMAGKEDERVESEGRFKETKKMTNKDKMAKAQRKSNSDIDHRPNKGKKAKGRSKSTNDVDIRTNGEVGAQKKKKKRRSTKDKDGLKKMSKRTSSRSNHTGVID